MKNITISFLCLLVIGPVNGYAAKALDFTIHKIEADQPGKTILVIAGIQGDEPGGFNAASLLVTRYQIHKGNLWVVPNLNFISIIRRSRGIHGDLNRKFAALQMTDPEYGTINTIKSLIRDAKVDLILNLHDGSGFYRPQYIDSLRNPNRWGQSVIIDQDRIDTDRFGELRVIADTISSNVNQKLIETKHAFHVMNTETASGNVEMSKTLTYFAIRNLKSAFGLEASKNIPTPQRVYYHLCMIEAFMRYLNISFERDFELSAEGVNSAIHSNVKLALNHNRILLDVENARNHLRYIPLQKNSQIEFAPSNPLLTIVNSGDAFRVYHGNRRLTQIVPQYFEYDLSINAITIRIDGRDVQVPFGVIVDVADYFYVVPMDNFRVNVIGYYHQNTTNESGISITRNDVIKRFSVDKKGMLYRVEVYRDAKFTGMVLVNFGMPTSELRSVQAQHALHFLDERKMVLTRFEGIKEPNNTVSQGK